VLVGALFLLSLTIIFIGMALTVLPMIMGATPAESEQTSYRDTIWTVGPPLVLLLLVVVLGVWIPAPLMTILTDAAALLEVHP
jgi:hydrogenase-4 component F